ncbi:iron-sulfur cluster assembly protein [Salinifilum aidingensis]
MTRLDSDTAAWRALGTVLDPELDESITELGFVAGLVVDGGRVDVELRLPTYFCAPNFAYLMVADAHDVVGELPGTEQVHVRLLDHFAAEQINAGVAAGDGFDAAFSGLSAGELDELRRTFLAKAHAVYQEQLATRLLRQGFDHGDLLRARLGDLPADAERERLERRRERLGLPNGPDAPLLLDEHGQPLEEDTLPLRLRLARTTRVSIEANAGWCRGLLDTRYASCPPERSDLTSEV